MPGLYTNFSTAAGLLRLAHFNALLTDNMAFTPSFYPASALPYGEPDIFMRRNNHT